MAAMLDILPKSITGGIDEASIIVDGISVLDTAE